MGFSLWRISTLNQLGEIRVDPELTGGITYLLGKPWDCPRRNLCTVTLTGLWMAERMTGWMIGVLRSQSNQCSLAISPVE